MEPGTKGPVTETPLSLVTDTRIQFCPWCGVKLSGYYAKRISELDRSDLQVPAV